MATRAEPIDIIAAAPIAAPDAWFSAEQLATLRLPGLPRSKRHINERAQAERWALKVDGEGQPLARRRAGRGGGTEYHALALPAAAQAELVARGTIGATSIPADSSGAHPLAANDETASPAWQWFDRQSEKTKAEARRRLALVTRIADFELAGLKRNCAVGQVAVESGIGKSTLWAWLALTTGLTSVDWLPALAPRRKGGGAEAEIDAEIWQMFKSDYLRLEKPTLAACYGRAKDCADKDGITIPIMKTFARKLEREVPPAVITLLREGNEALRRSIPAQRRTVKDLHAMQLVNIDGHKFDVFVRDGERVFRPIMVAIQDVYSRKLLAWRIGDAESAVLTRLAFADLFRSYGIPLGCLLDNGRAFASKWITGGALTRFRFKVREEDPTGLLPALGINPHWATPYRGQSKPIERAFRDLCDTVARHPAVAGAYTGNNPMAKPENYGSKAVPLADFLVHVDNEIARHNAREGRRTESANGRSFDAAFAESYAAAPIGKASPEQLRLALLAGENVRVDKRTGHIDFLGNRYWGPGLERHYGQIVTVRFDPDHLHQPIHVYDLAGRYLASPDIYEDAGFLDVEAARTRAKMEKAHRRAVREAAALQDLLTAEQVAAAQPKAARPEAPSAPIIRPVRHRGQTVAAVRTVASQDEKDAEFMSQLGSAMTRLRLVE